MVVAGQDPTDKASSAAATPSLFLLTESSWIGGEFSSNSM